MTAGFFGKLPTTGDFVSRNLPSDFIRAWDPWVSRHLVPLINAAIWPDGTPLFFLAGPDFLGPMTGVIAPSRDKGGRRYPLTIAARPAAADIMLLVDAHGWFEDVLDAALVAVRGDVEPDRLGEHLQLLDLPEPGAEPRLVGGLCLWLDPNVVIEADPADPTPALEELLKTLAEASSAPE